MLAPTSCRGYGPILDVRRTGVNTIWFAAVLDLVVASAAAPAAPKRSSTCGVRAGAVAQVVATALAGCADRQRSPEGSSVDGMLASRAGQFVVASLPA